MPAFKRLLHAAKKPVRVCVGLISGTSADAAEAVVCRIRGSGGKVKLSLLSHITHPFEPDFATRIKAVHTAQEVCALNVELGERFATAALAAIAAAGLTPKQVDVIGSHGQTVVHLPAPQHPVSSTLQIGEAAVIAERTGVPVICDFRPRDMAAGGQGAPLVPYLDWAIFRPRKGWRALLNVGGIANVSIVGQRLPDTMAFDTGPGNMLLDALAGRASNGQLRCDLDGALTSKGAVLPELLEELLRHPFLDLPPPKSGGRENFGEDLVSQLWARHGDRPFDLMATVLQLSVEAVARSLERWVLPNHPLEGVYVSGGGSRNPSLMWRLADRLAPTPVQPLGALGFPEGAKEAACFALLASEALADRPANVPSATGASHPVILGKMVP